MADVWPQIVLVVVLVVINAAFAGTELALVSLREGQLQRLEAKSATGAVLARLARQPNQFLATIQIGITLAGFLASAAAAVSLAEPLEGSLDFLGGAAGPVSIVVVTLVLAYFTLVFGELAPKRLAMQKAERWGSWPVRWPSCRRSPGRWSGCSRVRPTLPSASWAAIRNSNARRSPKKSCVTWWPAT